MKGASSPARRGRFRSEAGRHVAQFIVAACPPPENSATSENHAGDENSLGSTESVFRRSYRATSATTDNNTAMIIRVSAAGSSVIINPRASKRFGNLARTDSLVLSEVNCRALNISSCIRIIKLSGGRGWGEDGEGGGQREIRAEFWNRIYLTYSGRPR